MTASGWSSTSKVAWRRSSSTGQWRLQNGPTAIARHVIKDRLFATITWPFVAELGTGMVPTLELSATNLGADMLRLNIVVERSRDSTKRFQLPSGRLALDGFPLAGTASLTTLMAATIEIRMTDSHALGWLFGSLMTDRVEMVAPASASDIDFA